MGQRNTVDQQTYPKEIICPQSRGEDSVSKIISDLDEATSSFPSNSVLPDTPCVSAIRVHLQQSASLLHSEVAVPSPLRSPFSEGVDWRPQPDPSKFDNRPKTSYFTSLQRTFSTRTSKTVPASKNDWKHAALDIVDTPTHFQPDSHSPTEPDLQPLSAIFPNTPHHLLSSLYAHILAYSFLTTFPDHYSLPQTHTPPPSPLRLPSFTTTSWCLPDKAADRLGIVIPSSPTRGINVGNDAIILRRSGTGSDVERLVERIRERIGWLISEMNDDEKRAGSERKEIDQTFLRALSEVVKRCERDYFGAA
jgi:hypothetical protein